MKSCDKLPIKSLFSFFFLGEKENDVLRGYSPDRLGFEEHVRIVDLLVSYT
jgi:hypothetical protein